MDDLNDEILREQLKAFGEDVGPLTNSTRPYWKKALYKLKLKADFSQIKFVSNYETDDKSPLRLRGRSERCRSRSLGSPKYTSDTSVSVKDTSTSDMDSFITDSPGSTPFPTKIPRKQKSPREKNTLHKNQFQDSDKKYLNARKTKNSAQYSVTPTRFTKNRRVQKYSKKASDIQLTDKDLREKLKAFGEHVDRAPMNEAKRSAWLKRLEKLTSGLSSVERNGNSDNEIEYESAPEQDRKLMLSRYGSDDDNQTRSDFLEEDFSTSDSDSAGFPSNRIRNANGLCERQGKGHMDFVENEDKCFIQKLFNPRKYFFGWLKFIMSFLLQGIFYIVVMLAVFFLLVPNSSDVNNDEKSETD